MWKQKLLGFLLWVVYRSWISTWRVTVHEHPQMQTDLRNKTPFVFAFWHGDELPMISLCLRYPVATMISSSNDGEIMYTVARLLGVEASRGSSTRGGIRALLGLVKIAEKTGRIPSVAVDGPKGPLHKVKPGIFVIAQRLNARIYSAGVAAQPTKVFEKSWNKAHLPLPFSKVVVVWGAPVEPSTGENDGDLAKRLEHELHAARQAAAKYIASL